MMKHEVSWVLKLFFNEQAVLQTLAQRIAASTDIQRQQILIVPEQLSHEAERCLCEEGGDTICRRAEVLSFTRLAQRVFSIYGGVARRRLDGAGKVLAMSLTVDSLRSRLKYFASAAARPEFFADLLQMAEELAACCITPAQLLEVSRVQSGAFAQKLEELGLLLEGYQAVCAQNEYEAREALDALADLLCEEPYADTRCFVFGGFQDFTRLQLRVIESLLQRGAEVTVSLCCDGEEGRDPCFAAARRTARQLRALAAKYGVAVTTERRAPSFREDLAFALAHLYDGSEVQYPQQAALRLYCAATPRDECRAAVEYIDTAVRSGLRWRQIGVALCAPELRLELTQRLAACGVPYYCAGRADAAVKPLFALVLRALEAVAFGYRREHVIACLRTGLAGVDEAQTDLLENYALCWNIRGGKWFSSWQRHPDGYDARFDARVQERLEALNEARRLAVEPLRSLERALKGARDMRQQVVAVLAYLRAVQVTQRLEQAADQLRAQGREQLVQEHAQLYELLIGALEQLYALGGQAARSPESFYRLMQLLLRRYQVATIPPTLDCVMIGSLEELRMRRVETLLVLGAADGCFPAWQRVQSLISEEEREQLRRDGIELPGREEQLDRQTATVFSVLSSAEQQLYLSTNETQGPPAYLFQRLQRQFPLALWQPEEVLYTDYGAPELAAALLARPDAPQSLCVLRTPELDGQAQMLRLRAAYTPGVLDATALAALYGGTIRLSPSRMDRLAACRCAYFLEYGLRLEERRPYQFDAPVFGTFAHYVLEQLVRAVEQAGGFPAVEDAQIQTQLHEQIDRFAHEQLGGLAQQDARFTYLFTRNARELEAIVATLSREMRKSDFHAAAFELRFAPGGELPAIPVPGARLPAEVTGVVDRADLYADKGQLYFRVVDYKTGRKTLDYTDLSMGIGLQMLVYLFAIEKLGLPGVDGPLRPAGVLYYPAREPILSAPRHLNDEEAAELHRKDSRRSGLLLNDERLLTAMEHAEGDPEFLPYKQGKNGRKGDLVEPAQLSLLRGHVERSLRALVDTLAQGEVSPNPYTRGPDHGSCKWCPYEPVCHFSASGARARSMAKLEAAEFWEELEKEERHG